MILLFNHKIIIYDKFINFYNNYFIRNIEKIYDWLMIKKLLKTFVKYWINTKIYDWLMIQNFMIDWLII